MRRPWDVAATLEVGISTLYRYGLVGAATIAHHKQEGPTA
jgi:hypothetical protein